MCSLCSTNNCIMFSEYWGLSNVRSSKHREFYLFCSLYDTNSCIMFSEYWGLSNVRSSKHRGFYLFCSLYNTNNCTMFSESPEFIKCSSSFISRHPIMHSLQSLDLLQSINQSFISSLNVPWGPVDCAMLWFTDTIKYITVTC